MADLPDQILKASFPIALGVAACGAFSRFLMTRNARADDPASLPPPLPAGAAIPPTSLPDMPVNPYAMPVEAATSVIAEPVAPLPAEPATPGVSTRPYRAYDLLWVGFVFLLFFYQVLVTSRMPADPEPKISTSGLVVAIGFHFFLAGATILILLRRIRPTAWLGLRWKSWPWVFLIAPAAIGAMWSLMLVLGLSGYRKWMQALGADTVQDSVKFLQNGTDPAALVLMAVAAVLVAPVCEEIVFRGFLYPAVKRFTGTWPAAIFSALVFAAAHANLPALLPLFLFGLVLVFLYEKTGSLWAPVAVHFCFNGSTVLIQALARYYNLPIDTGV